ncbi:MAG: hypothetical protein AB1586_24955 [Pseudomonadota bacterium]
MTRGTPAREGRSKANWLPAAVIIACLCNVASVAGLNYQQCLATLKTQDLVTYQHVISEAVLLCPILVVLLARRLAPIVFAYASVLSAILAGRIYFMLIGLLLKQDWSSICQIFVGFLSALPIVVWALMRVLMWADEAIRSLRER